MYDKSEVYDIMQNTDFFSCGNVNWARRMDCNVCNTPKFGTIEPRTGKLILQLPYNVVGIIHHFKFYSSGKIASFFTA